jgi:hypothetical protein
MRSSPEPCGIRANHEVIRMSTRQVTLDIPEKVLLAEKTDEAAVSVRYPAT